MNSVMSVIHRIRNMVSIHNVQFDHSNMSITWTLLSFHYNSTYEANAMKISLFREKLLLSPETEKLI
jgi:hypothetical protein